MKPRVRLKRGSGSWFAAGAGWERALGVLSDAACKLFVHVCLRASGCLEFEREELARALGKSRSTLGRSLRELASKGVCELEAAPNQHRISRLRVHPQYWPYEVREEPRKPKRGETGRGGRDGDAAGYVAAVRRWF